jgi:hypothetical protein
VVNLDHWYRLGLAVLALGGVGREAASAQASPATEYRVLATTKTSTMENELNQAAAAGFRFQAVMGGETALGGNEVVAIASRSGDSTARYSYRLLATSKTSTLEDELQAAADAGFEYRGQTVFKSGFGGQEVACILERSNGEGSARWEYKLVATTRTGTLQKELLEAGAAGFELLGMTIGQTAIGGKELVAIMRRPRTN